MIDSTFFEGLRVSDSRFWLDEPVEMNRLSDGSVIKASLGSALWRGEITLLGETHAEIAANEARLAKLTRPGEFMLAHDRRFNGPAADPEGAILGVTTPVLHTVNADNKRIRVGGLPSGYVLTAGDYIGWQYGSPSRYALHRLVTGATASGAGLTPLFEVTPFVRPGFVTGTTAVVLVRPPIKCVLVDSAFGLADNLFTEGTTISFVQTLR